MIKALIFDMDGTLVNTENIAKQVIAKFLKKHRVKYKKNKLLEIYSRGYGIVLEEIFNENNRKFTKKLRAQLKKDYFAEIPNAKLMPYAKKMLQSVHKKAIMILATFSSKKITKVIMDRQNLHDFFDIKVSRDDRDHKEKVHMFQTILKETKLKPGECILIEDRNFGTFAGMELNIFTIGVKHTNQNIKGDVIAENLKDVEKIILEKMKKEALR